MAGMVGCGLDRIDLKTTNMRDYTWRKGETKFDTKEDHERMRDFLWNKSDAPYASVGVTDRYHSKTHRDFRAGAPPLPNTARPPQFEKSLESTKPDDQRATTVKMDLKKTHNLSIKKAHLKTLRQKDKAAHDATYKACFAQPEKNSFARDLRAQNHDIKWFPVKPTVDPDRVRSFVTEFETLPAQMDTTYRGLCEGHKGGRPSSPIRHREARYVKQRPKKESMEATPLSEEEQRILRECQLPLTTNLRTYLHPNTMPTVANQPVNSKEARKNDWHRPAPMGLTVKPTETKHTVYTGDYNTANTIINRSKISVSLRATLPAAAAKETASTGAATGFSRDHKVHTERLSYAPFFTTTAGAEFNEAQQKRNVDSVFDKAALSRFSQDLPELEQQEANRSLQVAGLKACSQYQREFVKFSPQLVHNARGNPVRSRKSDTANAPSWGYHDGFVVGVNSEARRGYTPFSEHDLKTYKTQKMPCPSASACIGPAMP